MMLYVIFPIHVNFPIRSSCVLKVFTEKTVDCFPLLEEVFFKKYLVTSTVFQSMSAYVHWCPENHEWTPKPTLKKKSQDFSVLYPVKKQATSHLKLKLVFMWKHVCALWTNTVQVVFLCNVISERSIQNCIGYCPHIHCLSAIWANIAQVISLCSIGSDRSSQILYIIFLCRVVCVLWVNIAQVISCAMLAQADQDNIAV